MGWFRRNRHKDEAPEAPAESEERAAQAPSHQSDLAAVGEGGRDGGEQVRPTPPGPKDATEVAATDGYVDFGSLRVPILMPMQFNIDGDRRKVGYQLVINIRSSALGVRLFAAPQDSDTWSEVSEELSRSVEAEGSRVKKMPGRWGDELVIATPTIGPNGKKHYARTRVVGFNGPRWFLRIQIIGPAATDEDEFKAVATVIDELVVVRDDKPRPPRSAIEITMPTKVPDDIEVRGLGGGDEQAQPQ